jgi:membrane dipeptidase
MYKLSKDEEERALALHKDSLVIDLHSHVQVSNSQSSWLNYIPLLQKGGVNAVFNNFAYDEFTWGSVDEFKSSIYKYDGIAMLALKDLEEQYSDIDNTKGKMIVALKAEDILKAKKNGKYALVLALEGAKPLEGKLYMLKIFYRLGLRHVQFNHNWRNQLSDGCVERNAAGLTDFGIDVVKEMNDLGMIIDVSHIAEPGFFDIIETTKDPIIASHVGSRALRNIKQNLTDEMIKAIAENGGVIGMHVGSNILKRELGATIEDIIDHIDFFVNIAGINHIGLGPDFITGGTMTKEQRFAMIKYFNKIRPEFYIRETPNPPTQGIENMWADIPNITKGLVARGYSDNEIKKILGENAIRLFKRVVG